RENFFVTLVQLRVPGTRVGGAVQKRQRPPYPTSQLTCLPLRLPHPTDSAERSSRNYFPSQRLWLVPGPQAKPEQEQAEHQAQAAQRSSGLSPQLQSHPPSQWMSEQESIWQPQSFAGPPLQHL